MGYTPATGTRPEDLSPNNFTPSNGLASQVQMETIYERPIPQRTDLFARHVGYVGFATMLSSMGRADGCSNPSTGHYEDPWLEDIVKVGSIVTASTGAGTDVVIALDAANMFTTPATSGGSAVKSSYVQVKDVIELYDRTQVQVTAKNTGVDPHQITLTPFDSTVDLAGKTVVGSEFGILYNLHAEASGLPVGRAPRILTYSNTFANIKHSFGATGYELTNSVYHETIAGDASSAGESIYVKIKADEIKRYEMSKSNALLFGQQPNNITELVTTTNLDTPVIGTEGLVEFALTAGTIDTYTVGSYAITDFDVVANKFYDERSATTNDLICWDGGEIATESENVFQQVYVNNLAPTVDRIIDGYGSYMTEGYHEGLDHDASDAAISFGYSAIKKNGFIFHLKRLSEFADIKRAGSTSYDYPNYRICMPVNYKTDAITGTSRSTVGYEYKQLGNYSRENVFGRLAGAGVGGDNTPFGQAVDQYDRMTGFLVSHIAGHFACGNAIVTQRPV